MVVIEQGSVEASLMMMNQVDSSNFDDDKDDDKNQRMISRFSQQFQDQDKFQVSWEEIRKIQESRVVWFQDSRKDEFKIQVKKSRRLHKGSIEKIFQKINIAQFCFSKEFFSKFSTLPEFLLSSNRLSVAKFDFKSF